MENDLRKQIDELQTELACLKQELEKKQKQAQELGKSRSAMLYMLEDLNKLTAGIEKAKNEWEATFDSISDPLLIHDKEFKIIRCNKAYAEAAGLKFNEIVGKPYFEAFPKMERPFKMCLKAQEMQEEEEEEEVYVPHINRIFKVRFYPIKKDVEGKYLYSIHILEDITEAKMAEERIKDEMEITSHLLMIAEATAHATDIDKLMGQVMHCGHKIIRCDVCLSYLWDRDAKIFRPAQCYGLAHEFIPIFRTEPLDDKIEFVKKAMGKGEPLTLPFPQRGEDKGEGAFPWLPNINTITAIPLLGKREPLGLIIGIYKTSREFTERDKKVMQGISHQVSTALEQAKIYKETVNKSMELSHKIETIQVMHEIDKSILSTLEAEDILETVTRLVSKVIPCDRTTVVLVDNERGGFIYKAGFGVTFISKGQFVSFKDTSGADVVKRGITEYVSNLAEVKGLLPLEEKFLKDGFLSHIRLPLLVKGEIYGILTVGAKRHSAFTPENLSTLERIASQIGVALENARLVANLEELFMGAIRALSGAIDAKSKWTAGHSERVTDVAIKIAGEMGMDEKSLERIRIAGLLHDIGKIGTYESILDKPDKLLPEELEIVKQHPKRGADILSSIKQLEDIIPAVKSHHEFYDGTGYPDGLKGENISLMARILTVADTVDAMTADRPYRKGMSMDKVIAEVKRCSGTQFDPKVVEVFLKTINPPATYRR